MAHGTLEHGAGDQEATWFQAPRPWRIRACRRVAGEGRTAEDQVAAAAADEDEAAAAAAGGGSGGGGGAAAAAAAHVHEVEGPGEV